MTTVFVAAAACVLYIVATSTEPTITEDTVLADHVKEAHAFSGANPGEYRMFLKNLDSCTTHLNAGNVDSAAWHLYTALDNLQTLPCHNHYGISDDVDAISQKIGKHMERTILREAIRQNVRFFPRYLND